MTFRYDNLQQHKSIYAVGQTQQTQELNQVTKRANKAQDLLKIWSGGRVGGFRFVGYGPHDDGWSVLVSLNHLAHYLEMVGQGLVAEIVSVRMKKSFIWKG